MRFIVLICAAALIASTASAAEITKDPDLGQYWHPLDNDDYTYIYADTFTMPDIPETTEPAEGGEDMPELEEAPPEMEELKELEKTDE